jgi:hypothetical protein
MPRCLGVSGHRRRFSGSWALAAFALLAYICYICGMSSITVRIPRSMAEQIDQARGDVPRDRYVRRMLGRMLEQVAEGSPEGGQHGTAVRESPSASAPVRASVKQRALEQTPGNSPEEGGPSRLTGAPSSARAPRKKDGPEDGIRYAQTIQGQTDIYEMLAGCPECAGRMESVGDGPQRCVDCGFTREES